MSATLIGVLTGSFLSSVTGDDIASSLEHWNLSFADQAANPAAISHRHLL
jgi:hypothetical protein